MLAASRRGGLRFPLKSLETPVAGSWFLKQCLLGNEPPETPVSGSVHHVHAPRAGLLQYPKMGDNPPDHVHRILPSSASDPIRQGKALLPTMVLLHVVYRNTNDPNWSNHSRRERLWVTGFGRAGLGAGTRVLQPGSVPDGDFMEKGDALGLDWGDRFVGTSRSGHWSQKPCSRTWCALASLRSAPKSEARRCSGSNRGKS
jgi:hypothetical protein